MKKAIAVLVAVIALAVVAVPRPAGAEEQVDEAKVNARIDARLHELLTRLLAAQRSGASQP